MSDLREKIAPCPFCGGEPKVYSRTGKWGVKCTCGGKTFIHTYGGDEAEAVAAWNNRPLLTQAEESARQRWYDIETAPRDGTQFQAMDTCGELFVAKYDSYGRVLYRMHELYRPEQHRIIDAEMDGKPVKAKVPINQPWPEVYEHTWVIWTIGFEISPTHWRPLPAPPLPLKESGND